MHGLLRLNVNGNDVSPTVGNPTNPEIIL